MTLLTLSPQLPYDFALSMRAMASFVPAPPMDHSRLRIAVRIDDNPLVLEFHQPPHEISRIEVRTHHQAPVTPVRRLAEWLLCADLDLRPFYRVARDYPPFVPIVKMLHGLKPMRPASLFEMVVIAITEQQISMAAAYHIRTRLVEHYGEQVDGLWAFPTAKRLCDTTIAELMQCGLSRRKAEYVLRLAERVASGLLDLDRLPQLSDEEVRELLLQERGLGPWSAEYFLVRGLSRPDRVPADDLGIRTIVGHYLGRGERLTAQGVLRKLAPLKPYRGLAAFYLLAHARLSRQTLAERR